MLCSKNPALIIDGLFGIGLNRPLDDGWKKFIPRSMNQKSPCWPWMCRPA